MVLSPQHEALLKKAVDHAFTRALIDPLSGGGRRMKKRGVFFVLLMLMVGLFPFPLFAAGKERIQNVTAEVVGQQIVVTAELVRGFNKEIISDLQNGIPKDFYYYLVIKRKQKNWYDEEIFSKTIRYSVQYDTLKKQYRISETEGGKEVHQVLDDFESTQRRVSKIDRIKIAPVSLLNPRHRYYVSVKAQMKASKLPLYLDYFLFFIPFLELDTPWSDSGSFSAIQGG